MRLSPGEACSGGEAKCNRTALHSVLKRLKDQKSSSPTQEIKCGWVTLAIWVMELEAERCIEEPTVSHRQTTKNPEMVRHPENSY